MYLYLHKSLTVFASERLYSMLPHGTIKTKKGGGNLAQRRLTDHPQLTFGSFHTVLEQTIVGGSHRDENPNGRGSAGLVYIVTGEVRYHFAEQSFSVRAGDLLFLPRGGRYTFDIGAEDYNYIFVNFDFAEDADVLPEVFTIRGDRIERYFRQLQRIYNARPPEYREECMSRLYAIYACIRREGREQYLPRTKRESVERAAAYIREHYSDPSASVAAAASVAGASLAHFRRLFCQVYSVSPQEYMMDLRIDAAKDLLSVSTLSVREVAEASGFASAYYFSRFFRIKTGLTPTEYRAKYANG